MSIRFGKYGVFEETMHYVGVDDINKTFPEADRYCYVTFGRGEGSYFVVFDDEKVRREQVMELTCDLYHPFDAPNDKRYEDQFWEQYMYKIPYCEVEKMLEKVIISFTKNGSDYIPLEKLNKVFDKYGDNFSIVPLKRNWEFLVVFGNTNKILRDTDFTAFDADSFIDAMRDREGDYWRYDTYFRLVLAVINDLRKIRFDYSYCELIPFNNSIQIPKRYVFDYLKKFEDRAEQHKERKNRKMLTEGAKLYT